MAPGPVHTLSVSTLPGVGQESPLPPPFFCHCPDTVTSLVPSGLGVLGSPLRGTADPRSLLRAHWSRVPRLSIRTTVVSPPSFDRTGPLTLVEPNRPLSVSLPPLRSTFLRPSGRVLSGSSHPEGGFPLLLGTFRKLVLSSGETTTRDIPLNTVPPPSHRSPVCTHYCGVKKTPFYKVESDRDGGTRVSGDEMSSAPQSEGVETVPSGVVGPGTVPARPVLEPDPVAVVTLLVRRTPEGVAVTHAVRVTVVRWRPLTPYTGPPPSTHPPR